MNLQATALSTANDKGLMLPSVLHTPRRSSQSSAPPRVFLKHHRAKEEKYSFFTFLMGEEKATSLKIRFEKKTKLLYDLKFLSS